MDPKYSNIFWHQGIKIFKDNFYESAQGRIKISHLENDVTKILINIFRHCSNVVLKEFLKLIQVKDHPDSFDFDFQVTDTLKFRQKRWRIMLSIIGASCEIKSDTKYRVEKGQPDACVFNDNISILIEVKTQSPLIKEQVQGYINQYLGSASEEKIITWEEITAKFNNIKSKTTSTDRFLLNQFIEFMELIGIAEFTGFRENDFIMLKSMEKISREDYLDFKRIFHKKAEKFMDLLNIKLIKSLNLNNMAYKISQVTANSPTIWTAFYFYNKDPNIHVNQYPNINFIFRENGINLSINAEIKSSVKILREKFNKYPEKFEILVKGLTDYYFTIYYKFQYFPMDHFIWRPIPGYAIESNNFNSLKVQNDILEFENDWNKLKRTLLYEMKSGFVRHPSGRLFNNKEIKYAENNNSRPNYSIRIEKYFSVKFITDLKKKIVPYFSTEISKLTNLIKFVIEV